MNSGPAQRDVEIRAAIDELNEAEKTYVVFAKRWSAGSKRIHPQNNLRVYRGWRRSKSLRAGIKRGTNYIWNTANDSSKPRRGCMQPKKKLVSLLPQHIGYEYKGKRYQRERSSYRVDNIG